jgi:hypothetical protein
VMRSVPAGKCAARTGNGAGDSGRIYKQQRDGDLGAAPLGRQEEVFGERGLGGYKENEEESVKSNNMKLEGHDAHNRSPGQRLRA